MVAARASIDQGSLTHFEGNGAGAMRLTASGPSLWMRLVRARIRVTYDRMPDPDRARKIHAHRTYPAPASLPGSFRERYDVRERRVRGEPVLTLLPKPAPSAWHIVYTHGGGYVNALGKTHWEIIWALLEATCASVTVPIYPLAPEHSYQEAYGELEEVYRALVGTVRPDRIVLCGDSAGAALALGQVYRFREKALPPPAHVFLFSPWLDVTLSNPEAAAIEPHDPMLRIDTLRELGRWWAGGADPKLPLISPLFGDPRGLPPVRMYHGTDDILLPDARLLRDRVIAAGGSAHLFEFRGAYHGFVGAMITPEAREVFSDVRKTLAVDSDRGR
jgi:epsilon-lactone hydrolase